MLLVQGLAAGGEGPFFFELVDPGVAVPLVGEHFGLLATLEGIFLFLSSFPYPLRTLIVLERDERCALVGIVLLYHQQPSTFAPFVLLVLGQLFLGVIHPFLLRTLYPLTIVPCIDGLQGLLARGVLILLFLGSGPDTFDQLIVFLQGYRRTGIADVLLQDHRPNTILPNRLLGLGLLVARTVVFPYLSDTVVPYTICPGIDVILHLLAIHIGVGEVRSTFGHAIGIGIVFAIDQMVIAVIGILIVERLEQRGCIFVPRVALMRGLLAVRAVILPGLTDRVAPLAASPDLFLMIGILAIRPLERPSLFGIADPSTLGPLIDHSRDSVLAFERILLLLDTRGHTILAGVVLNQYLVAGHVEVRYLANGHRPVVVIPYIGLVQRQLTCRAGITPGLFTLAYPRTIHHRRIRIERLAVLAIISQLGLGTGSPNIVRRSSILDIQRLAGVVHPYILKALVVLELIVRGVAAILKVRSITTGIVKTVGIFLVCHPLVVQPYKRGVRRHLGTRIGELRFLGSLPVLGITVPCIDSGHGLLAARIAILILLLTDAAVVSIDGPGLLIDRVAGSVVFIEGDLHQDRVDIERQHRVERTAGGCSMLRCTKRLRYLRFNIPLRQRICYRVSNYRIDCGYNHRVGQFLGRHRHRRAQPEHCCEQERNYYMCVCTIHVCIYIWPAKVRFFFGTHKYFCSFLHFFVIFAQKSSF